MIPRFLKSLRFGLIVALVVAPLAAAIPTFLDWRENPSGIFHNPENGTQWPIVWDTFSSWFWPIALSVLLVATATRLIVYLVQNRRQA